MSKGIVIHLDNDKGVLEPSKGYFDQLGISLDYECCTTVAEFKKLASEKSHLIKALIFDLIGDKETEELGGHPSQFSLEIEEQFNRLRVPIFIYSGFLPKYEKFKYNGTVFKIDKDKGIEPVAQKIKLFFESGFLEVFCRDGIIEKFLIDDLHESFTTQFQNDMDIENIIKALQKSNVDVPLRTKEIFSRIAIRSLMSHLMINREVEGDAFNESLISAVEHYIRRINLKNIPIWTGDIFTSNDDKQRILILTPRCDVASKAKEELLVCQILKVDDWSAKNVVDFIKDNIKFKKFRYLPKTPVFAGGKADLSQQQIINRDTLEKSFYYSISLSDDLTNEILGKYCSYMMRTSIPEVDEHELTAFLK